MPALYPANPWSLGAPPSTSGQLEKCGIGLSLRLRGEKPIEPCRGRCSFGTRHSSRKGGRSSRSRRGVLSRHRDAACDPRRIGARISGIRKRIARGRLVDALSRPYRRDVYNSLENGASPPHEFVAGEPCNRGSPNECPGLRLQRLERIDHDRLDDRFVLFLFVLEFIRFRESPPERFHARIGVFVTHGCAFAADIPDEDTKWFAFSLGFTRPRRRPRGFPRPSAVSSVITLP